MSEPKFKIGDRVIWSNPARETHPVWHYAKGVIIEGPSETRIPDSYSVRTDSEPGNDELGVHAYGYELERYYDKKERA